jgi:hypothetical protein
MSSASALGLRVDDAVVLQASNKLTVRLLPCDVLARVADVAHQVADFEVELAKRLAETESPVVALVASKAVPPITKANFGMKLPRSWDTLITPTPLSAMRASPHT